MKQFGKTSARVPFHGTRGSVTQNINSMSTHTDRIPVTSSHRTSKNKKNERISMQNSKQPVRDDAKHVSTQEPKHKEKKLKGEALDFNQDDKKKDITADNRGDQSQVQDPKVHDVRKEEERLIGKDSQEERVVGTVDLGDPADNVVSTSPDKDVEPYCFESMEDLDNNLPETVILLTSKGGSKVYVVGTVHFSLESQKEVANVIRAVKPDQVVLELCRSRGYMVRWDEERVLKEALNLNYDSMRKIIQSSGIVQGGFYLLLLSFMVQITKQLGIAPGGEFRMAFKMAQEIENCEVWFGDRPLQITLQRLISSLSIWQITKLVFLSLSTDTEISKEELESWKNKDALERVVLKFMEELPQMAKVMVDERDMYLAYILQCAAQRSESNRVVGVVGLGHLAGIKKYWNIVDENAVQEVLVIPPPRRSFKIIKFTLKFTAVGLVLYGVHKLASKSSFYSNLFRWKLVDLCVLSSSYLTRIGNYDRFELSHLIDQSYWSMSNMVFDIWDSPVIQN